MVILKSEEVVKANEHLRGGDGTVYISDFYSKMHPTLSNGAGNHVVPEGASLGYHDHPHEYEFYYIYQGEAEYDDNGKKVQVKAGDMTVCIPGEGHGIRNIGKGELKFVGFKIAADQNNK